MGRSSEHQECSVKVRREIETCCVCGNKEKPEGHHVIDYHMEGGRQHWILVTLCQKCHKQVQSWKYRFE